MSHHVAGARGRVTSRDDVLRRAQGWAAAHSGEVLLADAAAVFGRDHLESAALHAERARDADAMSTKSVAMEALLYLAAERQVGDAIQAAGIKEGTETIALIVFADAPAADLIQALGWSQDDRVLEAQGKDLGLLSISAAERSTVSAAQAVDLALERTALLDVVK